MGLFGCTSIDDSDEEVAEQSIITKDVIEKALKEVAQCSNGLETINKVIGTEKLNGNALTVNISQECKDKDVSYGHFYKYKVDKDKVELIETDS